MKASSLRRMSCGAVVLFATASSLLGGCSSAVKLDEAASVETRQLGPNTGGSSQAGASAGTGASSGSAPQSQVAAVDLTKAAGTGTGSGATAATARVVWFDFDSFVVKDEYRNLIDAHARALSASKGKRMAIEGHTDERGGREYNLALGQKRAEAVAKSMALLGVGEAQVEAVSFGKERPSAEGHDESAWAKNRRAELKDR